jgi:hypothetical protein
VAQLRRTHTALTIPLTTRYGPKMSIATRLCVLVVICVVATGCGDDSPTSPSETATPSAAQPTAQPRPGLPPSSSPGPTRLELFVSSLYARPTASKIDYQMNFGLGVRPAVLEPGHEVTIQRAITTLFGPGGTIYHSHSHASWIGEKWVRGGHLDMTGAETIYNDRDTTRPFATRYQVIIDYTVKTPSGTAAAVVTATGDVGPSPWPQAASNR